MTQDRATLLLERIDAGDSRAAADLLPLLYDELHRIAGENMARERSGHTLQATALVHEAWVRLVGGHDTRAFNGRDHFLRAAAQVMRRVLVDYARRRSADKRGGDAGERLALENLAGEFEERAIGLVELDDALGVLAREDPELAEIVELRFFTGSTMPEVAALLDVSLATAERRWRVARMWLARQLEG